MSNPKDPTILEIASHVKRLGAKGNYVKNAPAITEGLSPKKCPDTVGYHKVKPEQLLHLRVARLRRKKDGLIGYQRPLTAAKARRMAKEMLAGEPFPPIHVALHAGFLTIDDGQHRAVAAIMAGLPVAIVIERLDLENQRKLFANQRKGTPPNTNLLILAANDPYSEYIQDAVTGSTNPWSSLVSMTGSTSRITPLQMRQVLVAYVGNTLGQLSGSGMNDELLGKWDEKVADEAAGLIAVFGTKRTNPLAFRPVAVRALAQVMATAIRRHDRNPDLIDRWGRVMPKFPFDQYPHLRSSNELADQMLVYWNKRLSQDKKATR